MQQGEESTSLCDTKYKVVFLGDMGVGKTSIIERFVKDEFDPFNNPTVGIDFLTRNISYMSKVQHLNPNFRQLLFNTIHSSDKTYRLQLWDTAGQEKYKSLVPAYLRDANCSVFVFDWGRPESFDNLRKWVQLYRDHEKQLSVGIVIGNKYDMVEEPVKEFNSRPSEETDNQEKIKEAEQIQPCTEKEVSLVSEATVRQFCQSEKLFFRKISAKTGKGVLAAFQKIIHELNHAKNSKQRQFLSESINESQFEDHQQNELEKSVMTKFGNLKLKNGQNGGIRLQECCYI